MGFFAKLDITNPKVLANLDPTMHGSATSNLLKNLDPTNPNATMSSVLAKLDLSNPAVLAKLDPTNPNSGLGKMINNLETGALAPIRFCGLMSLRLNLFNSATIFKAAEVRDYSNYDKKVKKTWYNLGGNRTKFNEAVNAGYRKRPVFSSSMGINAATLQFDGDNYYAAGTGKTLQIPKELIVGIPVGLTAFGAATSGGSAAAAWGAWGGILAGLFGVINSLNIPLKGGESNPGYNPNDSYPDASALQEQLAKDALETNRWIPFMSNWITGGVIVVAVAGGIYLIVKK